MEEKLYELKRDAVRKRIAELKETNPKKYTQEAISRRVTDYRNDKWLSNALRDGSKITEPYMMALSAELSMATCDIASYAGIRANNTKGTKKHKNSDEIVELLKEILYELRVWNEPINMEDNTHD